METKETQIELINKEINRELKSNDVSRALLATTFKGLDAPKMKQAIMEGMIRGFSFKNFLQKDIYAIPFGSTYSLVTSIDYARKVGMRSSIVGKDAPVYTEDDKGGIITCSVTVHKKVGEYIGDYTSLIYFKEYTTGKNLWVSKPRTMIAKVAEMHALRMACPEEMAQVYVEEELEKEKDIDDEKIENRLNKSKAESESLKMSNLLKDGKDKTKEGESQNENTIEVDGDAQGDENKDK